jgi:tetratricopeptide (TPR) repeat protein
MKSEQEKYPVPEGLLSDFERAAEMIKLGGTMDPREILEKLLAAEPDHPRLLNSLAASYLNEGNFPEAERLYLRIIELAPDFELPYGNLTLIYQKTGEIDKAIQFADMLLAKGSHSASTWDFVGLLHFKKGDYEIALEYFLAAVSLDRDFLKSSYNIACTYVKLERIDEALPYLELGLKDVQNYQFALTDRDLDPIRDTSEFKRMMENAAKEYGDVEPLRDG